MIPGLSLIFLDTFANLLINISAVCDAPPRDQMCGNSLPGAQPLQLLGYIGFRWGGVAGNLALSRIPKGNDRRGGLDCFL